MKNIFGDEEGYEIMVKLTGKIADNFAVQFRLLKSVFMTNAGVKKIELISTRPGSHPMEYFVAILWRSSMEFNSAVDGPAHWWHSVFVRRLGAFDVKIQKIMEEKDELPEGIMTVEE